MAKASRASTDLIFEADDDDLSTWEIINPSDDDDDEDIYSFDEDDGDVCKNLDVDVDDGFGSLSSDLSSQSLSDHLNNDRVNHHVAHIDLVEDELSDVQNRDDDYDEEEDDDGDGYYDDFDLDDELVPKCVSDRFGRERMRKLGKRAYPKMNKSKRLPYFYIRPGCVHGKHGLGLKHSIV